MKLTAPPDALLWAALLAVPPGVYGFALASIGAGWSALLVLLAALVLSCHLLGRRRFEFPVAARILLVLAALYALGLSYFGAWGNPQARGAALLMMALPVLYAGVFNTALAYPTASMQIMLRAILGSLVITAFIGLLQQGGYFPDALAAPSFGFTGHQNAYGYACALGFAVALPMLSSRLCIGGMVSIGILLVGVAISLSRGAWLSVGLVLVLHAALLRSRSAFLSVLILLVCAVVASEFSSSVAERLRQEDVSSGRYLLWLIIAPSTLEEVLLGRGTGFMWQLVSTDINQWGGYVSENNESIFAHNDLLFLLVELGVSGVVLWIGFWGRTASDSLRLRRSQDPPQRIAARAAIGSLGVLLVASNVDTVLFGSGTILKFVALAAIVAACVRGNRVLDVHRQAIFNGGAPGDAIQ